MVDIKPKMVLEKTKRERVSKHKHSENKPSLGRMQKKAASQRIVI